MGASNAHVWSRIVKEAWDRAFFTAKFFCLLHVSNTYLCTIALAYGPSMLPTINLTGDCILADRLSVRFGKVGPGDIVLVRSPQNPRKIIMKRVVGMGGDLVTFSVDPKNSHKCETVVRGMFGLREITHTIPLIQGILVLFLKVCFTAKCSGGYGHLKVLDR